MGWPLHNFFDKADAAYYFLCSWTFVVFM